MAHRAPAAAHAPWISPRNTLLDSADRPLRILFLTAGPPSRSLQGYRIRAYHQLRILGPRHRITLISFADPRSAALLPPAGEEFCERVVTVPLQLGGMARSLLRGGFSDVPLQATIYESPAMRRAIRDTLARQTFDVVHVQLARMAQYLADVAPARRVIDLVDALSLNMRRRYHQDRSVRRWAAYIEARRLKRYERAICASVDGAMVGSALDRQAMGSPPGLATVTSGVDLREFPFRRAGREANTVVFTGNMSYFPNVQGVLWFARSVWPLIKQMNPAARLSVVGAWPDRAIRRLAENDPSIAVSGFVEHVHPHLCRAAVAIAPMLAGSGQQLKVLEAMASGTPMISTSLAADSIEARHCEHLLVADGPKAFAAQTVRLLADNDLAHGLALNGRRLVEERYTWERSVAQLETIYRSLTSGDRRPESPGSSA